jgi:hypothetical protein
MSGGFFANLAGAAAAAYLPQAKRRPLGPPKRHAQITAERGGWRVEIQEDEQQAHANIWRVIFSRSFPRLSDAIRSSEAFTPATVRVL